MKLLFDANLSPALIGRLRVEYPDSVHVRDVGLRNRSDAEIWEYAKGNGFVIASKDTDFRERSFVEGSPPKVIWLDVGNAGTRWIECCSAVNASESHSSLRRRTFLCSFCR